MLGLREGMPGLSDGRDGGTNGVSCHCVWGVLGAPGYDCGELMVSGCPPCPIQESSPASP